MEETIRMIVIVLSALTIPISILNYSILLSGDHVRMFLGNKVKEFLGCLVAIFVIISLKVIFGCTLLNGIIHTQPIVRHILTLALTIYFFIYNIGLLTIFLKHDLKPVLGVEIRDIVALGMLLYLFFDKIHIGYYMDHLSRVFLVFLVYTLFRMRIYLKVSNMLFEPINVIPATKFYLICSYLTAIACITPNMDVAKSIFFLATIKAIISLILFDREIRWLNKYKNQF